MDQKSRDVLDAADRWVAAAIALTNTRLDGSEEDELDAAETALLDAVKVWRLAGRPS